MDNAVSLAKLFQSIALIGVSSLKLVEIENGIDLKFCEFPTSLCQTIMAKTQTSTSTLHKNQAPFSRQKRMLA